jgi:hypothetical protein
MTNQLLDNLKYMRTEPVPDIVWTNIERALAHKNRQIAPFWMRIAAALIALALLSEIASIIQFNSRSLVHGEYASIFKPNNQWYYD